MDNYRDQEIMKDPRPRANEAIVVKGGNTANFVIMTPEEHGKTRCSAYKYLIP